MVRAVSDRRLDAERFQSPVTGTRSASRRLGVCTLATVLLGCTAPGTRPHFGPLPAAVTDTLAMEPESAIVALQARLVDAGLRVRRLSPAEGYLETDWFDLRARKSVAPDHLQTDRVVRVRVWADPEPPGRARVVVEAVYRKSADPSARGREQEIVAPPGHPGDSLTRHLLQDLPQPPERRP